MRGTEAFSSPSMVSRQPSGPAGSRRSDARTVRGAPTRSIVVVPVREPSAAGASQLSTWCISTVSPTNRRAAWGKPSVGMVRELRTTKAPSGEPSTSALCATGWVASSRASTKPGSASIRATSAVLAG